MSESKEDLLTFEKRGRIHVGTIRASRMLSTTNAVEFGTEAMDYVKAHPGINLLLNFEYVDYLSSIVLTELLKINKAVKEGNGRLRLCAVGPSILEVFEITNLDKVFVIHAESVDTDIKRFERALDVAAEADAWVEPTDKE